MADHVQATKMRQAEILDAARDVFIRYGFRKTSMEDLARAAGLSRQGLYLHFASKEALFEAMAIQSLDLFQAEARKALTAEQAGIEDRLLKAFLAVHGNAIGSEVLGELVATTTQLLGPTIQSYDETFVADLARALSKAGVPERWAPERFSAKSLAEHLFDASVGIKHKARSPSDYLARMRVAIRLVCRGTSR